MVNVVLCDLDLQFQGQPFSFLAFVIKNALAADVPGRLASTCTVPDVELLLPFYIFMILSLFFYSIFCTFILFLGKSTLQIVPIVITPVSRYVYMCVSVLPFA